MIIVTGIMIENNNKTESSPNGARWGKKTRTVTRAREVRCVTGYVLFTCSGASFLTKLARRDNSEPADGPGPRVGAWMSFGDPFFASPARRSLGRPHAWNAYGTRCHCNALNVRTRGTGSRRSGTRRRGPGTRGKIPIGSKKKKNWKK